MTDTIVNQPLMEMYRQLIKTLYTEPKDEEILGSFLHHEGITEVNLIPTISKKKERTFKIIIIT